MKTTAFIGLIGSASLQILLAAPAHAQGTGTAASASDAAPEIAEEEAATSGVSDIVVTARRRDESLQEVPVAVTAVTSEQLSARSVQGLGDVAQFTPSLYISEAPKGGSIAFVNIRGQDNPYGVMTSDSAVGIYFDDIYVARSAGNLFAALQDMESVQILRGNQGTLFGRNNTGGAILLTPNRPNLSEVEGRVGAVVGNYNRYELSGVLSVPIIEDKVAIRGSILKVSQDGVGKSSTTGITDYGNRDRTSGRASIRFQPTDRWTTDISYDFTRVNEAGTIIQLYSPTTPPADFRTTRSAQPPLTYLVTSGQTFRTVYELSEAATFKLIAGHREMRYANNRDVDGLPATSVDVGQWGRQKQISVEGQVSGSVEFGDGFFRGLNYVAGAFYFREKGFDAQRRPYDSTVLPFDLPITGPGVNFRGDVVNKSVAGYGQVEFELGGRSSAWVGLRKTKDTRSLVAQSYNNGNCALAINPPGCVIAGGETFSYWSWSAGVRHKISDDVNVYFRAAKGQRAGGLQNSPAGVQPFEPELLTDYEVGLKASLLNGKLRTSIAAYTGDNKQIQRVVQLIHPTLGSYTDVFNAATGTIRGIELEAQFQPVPELQLVASGGFIDADYGEFLDTRAGMVGQDASGNKFPDTSKWSYSLSGVYTANVSDRTEMSVRLDYSWRSTVYYQAYNDPRITQPSYGLLNARVGLKPEIGDFRPEFSLFMKNITDKKYLASGTLAGPNAYLLPSDQPRMYGLEVALPF